MVKTPGWFHFSAAAVARPQAAFVSLSLLIAGTPFLMRDDSFDGGFDTLLRALPGRFIPPLAGWVGKEFGAAGRDFIGQAEILGMVGDREPVQRPVDLGALVVVDDDFPASGVSEEVVGSQRDPEHSRVEGVAGVVVGSAPEDAVGELLVRVGRIIGPFLCSPLGGSIGRRGILGRGEVD